MMEPKEGGEGVLLQFGKKQEEEKWSEKDEISYTEPLILASVFHEKQPTSGPLLHHLPYILL